MGSTGLAAGTKKQGRLSSSNRNPPPMVSPSLENSTQATVIWAGGQGGLTNSCHKAHELSPGISRIENRQLHFPRPGLLRAATVD